MRHTARVLLFALLTIPSAGLCAFDVVVSGNAGSCIAGPLTSDTEWLDTPPEATIHGPTGIRAITATPGGRLLAARGGEIVQIRPGVPAVPVGSIASGEILFMVADAAGNLFALVQEPTPSRTVLLALTPNFELRARYVLDDQVPGYYAYGGIDLASDQCTLYLARDTLFGGSVRRFNVCTETEMALFTFAPGVRFTDVKVLENGDVLVAIFGQAVRRYSAAGVLLGTIPLPGPAGTFIARIALASGGRTLFAAYSCNGGVRHWDLGNTTLLREYPSGIAVVTSLLASNAWTAAFGNLALTEAPALSSLALLVLAGLLSLLAMRRLM